MKFLIFVGAFLAALLILNRYMFGLFGRGSIVRMLVALVLFFIIISPSLLIAKLFKSKSGSWLFIQLAMVLSILLVVTFSDLCVCEFN